MPRGYSRLKLFILISISVKIASQNNCEVKLAYNIDNHIARAVGFHINEEFKLWNKINCLGYIPVIGVVIGIARIYFGSLVIGSALFSTSDPSKQSQGLKRGFAHIGRGVLECIGCGLLLAIPDYILRERRSREA